mmetsp:Transcript_177385/g.568798  ORF Transcript_177385/g.568798 Transcript_177385/m.568798 type:complete len:290 (+) Transcript_177385:1017-1886(+)
MLQEGRQEQTPLLDAAEPLGAERRAHGGPGRLGRAPSTRPQAPPLQGPAGGSARTAGEEVQQGVRRRRALRLDRGLGRRAAAPGMQQRGRGAVRTLNAAALDQPLDVHPLPRQRLSHGLHGLALRRTEKLGGSGAPDVKSDRGPLARQKGNQAPQLAARSCIRRPGADNASAQPNIHPNMQVLQVAALGALRPTKVGAPRREHGPKTRGRPPACHGRQPGILHCGPSAPNALQIQMGDGVAQPMAGDPGQHGGQAPGTAVPAEPDAERLPQPPQRCPTRRLLDERLAVP